MSSTPLCWLVVFVFLLDSHIVLLASTFNIQLVVFYRIMSLINQTAWVVGGVGVVGRGITRGLLQAGATVIVNSRSQERLQAVQENLDFPERLITVHGSLLPGQSSFTVQETLKQTKLHHVVAHGAVRWWARPTAGTFENHYEFKAGCDESYSLNIKSSDTLLNMKLGEFGPSSSQLASLHLSAAQQLVPRLEGTSPTYTFVTGDGAGKPGGDRTAMGEINSHHVWGLSAALRHELTGSKVNCREIRVGLPVEYVDRPMSEAVGDLCAGLAAKPIDHGRVIQLDSAEEMERVMHEYHVDTDGSVKPIPHQMCDQL
jgi:NAD(P)-dependent dehydrogenase (short-subunit alcohol dehydrogenase family)